MEHDAEPVETTKSSGSLTGVVGILLIVVLIAVGAYFAWNERNAPPHVPGVEVE